MKRSLDKSELEHLADHFSDLETESFSNSDDDPNYECSGTDSSDSDSSKYVTGNGEVMDYIEEGAEKADSPDEQSPSGNDADQEDLENAIPAAPNGLVLYGLKSPIHLHFNPAYLQIERVIF